MKQKKNCGKWCPVWGVVTLSIFACSVTLYAGSSEDASKTPASGVRVVAGAQVPAGAQLPVSRPSQADWRNDGGAGVVVDGGVVAIGGRELALWETAGGMDKALTSTEPICLIDEQCATCDQCVTWGCSGTPGKCVYTAATGLHPTCDDGAYCNGQENCTAGVCEDGTPPCNPDPEVEVCDEIQDLCYAPCGTNADCDDGDDCTQDTCQGDGTCLLEDICTIGRCCVGDTCTASNLEDCAGDWLNTIGACDFVAPSGNLNDCPEYSAGIAPQGAYGPTMGPFSNLACDGYFSIGDDYQTAAYDAGDPATHFMDVEFLRMVGGVIPPTSARWIIEFYDENGILVEDVFWPDGANDSNENITIRSIDFDPPLTVPTKGYVAFRVMINFSPDGRVVLLPTDAVDVGTQNPASMWIDDTIRNFAGQCSGGDRDGLFCDVANGNDDCTGSGTCVDIPDVLALELVGTLTTAPNAACCDPDAGTCANELPWICKNSNMIPQQRGTLCGICGDGLTACVVEQDCIDAGVAGPCSEILACAIGSCCDPTTGLCTEIVHPATCGTGEEFLGFGTSCDPDCCEKPVDSYTGADDCSATSLQLRTINVPAVGAPPVRVTITGNNAGATYNEFASGICDDGIFNPDGGTKDPGWWEGFTIDDCANVRVELCCTDADGEGAVWRPGWGNLWTACDPCESTLGNAGVGAPVGLGRGTSGFARGAPYCNEDNLWGTFGPIPAGSYYYPLYSAPDGTGAPGDTGKQYQLHFVVGACPDAACCRGDTWTFENELECGDADNPGYWIYGNVDTPLQPDCSLADPDSPCCTGSCCTGPGECEDLGGAGEPMTQADCTVLGGIYVGGADCVPTGPNADFLDLPCPVCEIAGDNNCQPPDLNAQDTVQMSDRAMKPAGIVTADDFVPTTTDAITHVCVWGVYLDRIACRNSQETEQCDCNDYVTDDFLVRVYADDGGIPGALVGESAVSAWVEGPVDNPWYSGPAGGYEYAQAYEFQLQLDVPITGLTANDTHWIEVSNNTDTGGVAGNRSETCYWNWLLTSLVTNNHSVVGRNLEPRYFNGNERSGAAGDMSFCLSVPFTAPPAVQGGCCTCGDDAACTSNVESSACTNVWDRENVACGTTCVPVAPADDCASAYLYDPGEGGEPVLTYIYDNTCASNTVGLANIDTEAGLVTVGNDVWVHYIAPVSGRFYANMCGTGDADNAYDTALAVWYDNTDPTNCACFGDAGFAQLVEASDEGCTGTWDGGAGVLNDVPIVQAGDCITVQLAGFEGETGRGTAHIGTVAAACTLANTPLPDPRVTAFGGNGTRNRYLSFSTGSTGLTEGMRVKLVNLPSPHDEYNGDTWYVTQPVRLTEASGSDGSAEPAIWAATLTCAPSPFYADWSAYGVVHVYHDAIIPGATYEVQAISDDCVAADEDSYSPALVMRTSRMGDIVGDCGVTPCSAPQGVIDFVDISGCVDKFRNLPPAPQKSRADVINSNITLPAPDRKVDFVDISTVVDAFRGSPPPLPGPQGHCPP